MTREQNQLIKKIRNLSPDDIARLLQFLEQLKAPELRAMPPDLRTVAAAAVGQEQQTAQFEAPGAAAPQEDAGPAAGPATGATGATGAIGAAGTRATPQRQEAPGREPALEARSPEAEIARAACAQWRRRPFQAIDADDLQPIAALFREAVDKRAANRFRTGTR